MRIHYCNAKKLRSIIGYFLVFIIVFVSATLFYRIKDDADTVHLEQISGDTTETDGTADKNRATVISLNMHVQTIDVANFPEIDDVEPSRETHILWKIVLLSLIALSIITIIIVKRGRQNAKHCKSK